MIRRMLQTVLCLSYLLLGADLPQDDEKALIPIYEHRPIYGIVGKNDAKLQMSAKFKFIQPLEVYVGYTQLMMWNIYQYSIPMRDINYDPEIFYRMTFGENNSQWIDFGAFEH